MNLSIVRLPPELEADYDDFVRSIPTTLFFASLGYRNLLKRFLEAEDYYFVAQNKEGRIVGVLPSFIKDVPGKGSVANSLPFYGSHGGVIAGNYQGEVARALLSHFRDFVADRGCISSTIVSSPFISDLSQYEACTGFTASDFRIGQMTPLPNADEDPRAAVMRTLHSKTRNMVRKAEKLGIAVTSDPQPSGFAFLMQVHKKNMVEIGGMAKPAHFFDLVEKEFKYNTDYRLYMAWLEGVPIAALLLFYFNGTVEYFAPVIVKEYRSSQSLSLLIYHAMVDAVVKGFKWWNWGGTWLTQDGVYQFKRRWGAIDMPYRYFTTILDQRVLKSSKAELLNDFPYFYVAPFALLRT
jgi:Acetyltransferase (GNAT) domain